MGACESGIAVVPADIDPDVLAFVPSDLVQSLDEGRQIRLESRLGTGAIHQHANAPRLTRRLLRAHRQRPCCRAAEQRDELAAVHSITSSARASSLSGTWRPSAFAVLRLITSSNLVGCITGKSAGLAPLRTFPAYTPIWLNASERCVP